MYYLANAAPEILEESLQEAMQSAAGDIIAANIVKYDPDRVMYEHLERDAAAGGVSGGLLSIITSALSRKAKLLEDKKAGRFVEDEGFVPGEGEETVTDARGRYKGGREGDITKLAMMVALQRQDDPTGQDQEAWAKLRQAHEEVIGNDPDAQMRFEAEIFNADSDLAADRAANVINTELGEIANPEKRKSRAIESTISLAPADIIGADEGRMLSIDAGIKAELLEERNSLVGELMEVNNNINLAKAGIEDSAVDPDQRAAYEQMLVGRRGELAERIQAINAEIEGIDKRLSKVSQAEADIDLLDVPQTFDPKARREEAEQALDIETRLVARLREELAEL